MIDLKKKKHCYIYFSKSNAIFIYEIDKLHIDENRINRRAYSTTYRCLKAKEKENTEAIIINLPEFLLWAFVSSLECFPEAVVLQVSDL